MTDQPVSNPIEQGGSPEEMGTYVAKFVVAFLAGPVGSKLLNKIGVPIDSASATVFTAMALHKLHDIAKKQWPNSNWL